MRTLPEHNIWNTVLTESLVTRQLLKYQLVCDHKETCRYTRYDHHTGSISHADTFNGLVCRNCGTILKEEQINGEFRD